MEADLVGVVGQLDAAGLAAAADLHLGLHDDRVAGRLGRGDGLVDRVGHVARADTGMSKRAKYCLPWYSNRSTGLSPLSAIQLRLPATRDPLQRTAGAEDLGDALLARAHGRRRRG